MKKLVVQLAEQAVPRRAASELDVANIVSFWVLKSACKLCHAHLVPFCVGWAARMLAGY